MKRLMVPFVLLFLGFAILAMCIGSIHPEDTCYEQFPAQVETEGSA